MINLDRKKHIGILGAMPEEVNSIIEKLKNVKKVKHGDLNIFSGVWYFTESSYINVSVAWSGWGKVSAARAATRIISSQIIDIPLDLFIFIGVAGAASENLKQWDIVIADKIYQHDFDARPFFDELTIPALGNKYLSPQNLILKNAYEVINRRLEEDKSPFNNIYIGSVATGDKFINSQKIINKLSKKIDNLTAIEMEGGAFAQVCFQENIPWIVLRVISDNANEEASEKFEDFIKKYNKSSAILISFLLEEIANKIWI